MRHIQTLIPALVICFSAAMVQAEVKPGTYYCVPELLVGDAPKEYPEAATEQEYLSALKWMADRQNRVAGRFQISPEKFMIKISKFAWESKKQQDQTCHPGRIWTKLDLAIRCSGFPLNALELPEKYDVKQILYSTGSSNYTDGQTLFVLDSNLAYQKAELSGVDGAFIEVGQCAPAD